MILASAIASAVTPVHAQVNVLEEVIVTAQKRAQSANDIGMAISSLSGDAINELRITDTTDLAVAIPGMTFSNTGLSTPVYTLRGVGFNEESVQATATVGVYNDQIPVAFPVMTNGLLIDVERVEVMKGPQGTLFGRNSTGGAINYIANKPSEEFEASFTGGIGNFDTYEVGGFVSGSLSEKITGRVAVKTVQSNEGWQESITRDDDLGEQDKAAARAILNIDASDSVNVLLTASWWQDKSDTQAPQFVSAHYNGKNPALSNMVWDMLDGGSSARIAQDKDNQDADWWGGDNRLGKPQADMDSHTFSATVTWDISDNITLTSLSSYSEYDNDASYNVDGWGGFDINDTADGLLLTSLVAPAFEPASIPFLATVAPQVIAVGLYDNLDTVGASAFTKQTDVEAWSQEFRLSGTWEDVFWTAGLYASSDQVIDASAQVVDITSSTNYGHLPAPLNIGTVGAVNETDQESDVWAVFGQAEWQFADDLKLTVGLRYTEDEKDFKACSRDYGFGDLSTYVFTQVLIGTGQPSVLEPGGCVSFLEGTNIGGVIKKSLDEDSTSGKLALDWTINDDMLAYASYSRGFKSGSFPTLTTNDSDQLNPVTQEQVDAYEIGIKATLADGAAQFNAAAFYYDYDDKQLLSTVTTVFGELAALANVPESEVKGVEFDAVWQPLQGLTLSAGAAYIDTEIKEYTGTNQLGVAGDMSGSEFPLTPDFQATVMVNYEWGVSDNLSAFVGVDASYSSEFNSDYAIDTVTTKDDPFGTYEATLAAEGATIGSSFGVDDDLQNDSVTLVGARLGVKSDDGAWSAVLWGRNLTDEFQPLNVARRTDALVRYTGKPRTYGVSFTYNWM